MWTATQAMIEISRIMADQRENKISKAKAILLIFRVVQRYQATGEDIP